MNFRETSYTIIVLGVAKYESEVNTEIHEVSLNLGLGFFFWFAEFKMNFKD